MSISIQTIRRAAADGLLAEKTVRKVIEGAVVRPGSRARAIAALRALGVSEADLAQIERAGAGGGSR